MSIQIKTFKTIEELATLCIKWLSEKTSGSENVSIALSGGRTPLALFQALKNKDWSKVSVEKLQVFWGDERCVSPDHIESNYGNAIPYLTKCFGIPAANIFRIHGENNPQDETVRYSQLIDEHIVKKNDFPVFDLIYLGMGEDGHTASIFPGNEALFETNQWCATTRHPRSGQHRITLTGSLINHSKEVVLLVTGIAKASIVQEVAVKRRASPYPVSLVKPANGTLVWLLDEAAASLLPPHFIKNTISKQSSEIQDIL
jgi:6-phosphogluconolactonase